MAEKANSDRMVSISKVEMGLAFHGIENRADLCATIVAIPRGGVSTAEDEAYEGYREPDGHGNINTFADDLGLEGDNRETAALKVIQRVRKFRKNQEQQNAYNEEPAAPAENDA